MNGESTIKKKKLNSPISNSSDLNNVQELKELSGINLKNNDKEIIDEDLYSRQIYVLGKEAMNTMSKSRIVISGLGGLGVEIAKNVILAGIKHVTLQDTQCVTSWDLSSQYYFKDSDVGMNRAEVSYSKLSELNYHVSLHLITQEFSVLNLKDFDAVVLTNSSYSEVKHIGDLCHSIDVKLIVANTFGLFGQIFCDFGANHCITDENGEEPLSVIIQNISKDKDGLVFCLEESKHGFQTGDFVEFSEVCGMTELNEVGPIEIRVDGPASFRIGDTSNYSNYISGGICTQVKLKKIVEFKSFDDALKNPEFVVSDFAKFDSPQNLHVLFHAMDKWDSKYFHDFDTQVKSSKDELEFKSDISDDIIFKFTKGFNGNLCPIQSVIGGIASQEALKAITGKFNPIKQFFYFDALECLESKSVEPTSSTTNGNSKTLKRSITVSERCDGQRSIFGDSFQNKLADMRVLIVGAGAIGCELLKNFAMIGLGCGNKGKIIVTDMDMIEKSNLNRQFLFRNKDIGKLKSKVAADAAKNMNSKINIEALDLKVGQETENIFDDVFFSSLDLVVNALDNVEARRYMDRRCVYYKLPLLESGTLGTKCNVQVVLPHLTESYSSSQDPPEQAIPICTLKHFPYLIEHTIQWARDLFEGLFVTPSISAIDYYNDKEDFIIKLKSDQNSEIFESFNKFVSKQPQSFHDCVFWGRSLFFTQFSQSIKQLLYNFPPNATTSRGQPFWAGSKRCPRPLDFDITNESHINFVYYASRILARIFNIDYLEYSNGNSIKEIVSNYVEPKFVPQTLKIPVNDSELSDTINTDDNKLEKLIDQLRLIKNEEWKKIQSVEFEKDDDSNYHIDFINAASNLRAEVYHIEPVERLKTKQIAGKIIPAIATTTGLVAGLVTLELYKIVQNQNNLENFKNGFINLALPFFAFSEPLPPSVKTYRDYKWTEWDRIELIHPMSLKQVIDYFKTEFNLSVSMMSQGLSMIYGYFQSEKVKNANFNFIITELIEKVNKRPISPHHHSLVLDVTCVDDADNDVDVPFIKYIINNKVIK